MGFLQILQLIMALPQIIKLVIDVINLIRGIKDPDEKVIAQAELDAIQFEVMRKKRVGRRERERLEDLRSRLRGKK